MIESAENFAFKQCDMDNNGCLTKDEVKKCIEEYGRILPDVGISLPTERNFDKTAGEDGCLTIEELVASIKGKESKSVDKE